MDLPKEQKEEMFRRILKHVAESVEEEETNATISTDMVHKLTGIDMTEEYVLSNKEPLNKEFGHLAAAYGFQDFHDFYLYAMSCDEQEQVFKAMAPSKSKQKDFSKLKPVRRTVIRNGRPTEMTFYEDPNKDKNKPQGNAEQGEAEEPELEPADSSELLAVSVGSMEKRSSIEEVKEVMKLHEAIGGFQKFDADVEKYMVFVHSEHKIPMAILGFIYEGGYTKLVFSDRNDFVKNWDVRLFHEAVKEALREGTGVSMPHLGTEVFDILVSENELEIPETKEGQYTSDNENLMKVYGYDA